MTSGIHSKGKTKFVILRFNKTRYIVGKSVAGYDSLYLDICETKTEANAKWVMEALARMEEGGG